MRYRYKGSWLQLVSGILMILAGVLFFLNPLFVPSFLVYLLAFSTLFSGISTLIFFFRNKDHPFLPSSFLVSAILNILLGILLLFVNPVAFSIFFVYFLAGWLLVQAITQIVGAFRLRKVGLSYWWLGLVVAILGIALAILAFFNPMELLLGFSIIAGIYLVVFGIVRIVEFFAYR